MLIQPVLSRVITGVLDGVLSPSTEKTWYARLDGIAQYWQLSETIELSGDFEVEINVIGFSTGYLFGDSNPNYDPLTTRVASFNGLQYGWLGNPVSSSDPFKLPSAPVWYKRVNGVISSNTATSTRDGTEVLSFDRVAGPYGGTTSIPMGDGLMWGLKVWTGGDREAGNLIVDLPLTNKAEGAVQSAIQPIGMTATLLNYTEAVWEEQ
ncbi:hypothetical protein ACQEXS_02675 [Vibrio sp. TRT 17S01]